MSGIPSRPGHVDLVRRVFFAGMPRRLLAPLTEALEAINDHLVQHGTLPSGSAFLQKPFSPDGLARKVRDVLDATV